MDKKPHFFFDFCILPLIAAHQDSFYVAAGKFSNFSLLVEEQAECALRVGKEVALKDISVDQVLVLVEDL